ncbi:type I restriction enzyme S protein (fragment) [Helicobacter bizzozeronii CCUG 35545]
MRDLDFVPLYALTLWDRRFKNVPKEWQPTTTSFKHVSATRLKALNQEGGEVKLLSTGIFDGYTTQKLAGADLNTGEVISLPTGGRAYTKYHKGLFVDSGNLLATCANPATTNLKFVFYYLQSQARLLESFYQGAGIAHPDMASILAMLIPLPPLSVQEKIVKILEPLSVLSGEC